MFKCQFRKYKLRLYLNGLLCSFLISGCASTGGNFSLGQADANLADLAREYPDIAPRLVEIKAGVMSAQADLASKEKTIDSLAKSLENEQEKSQSRLLLIWKLTSGILGLLLVLGLFLSWKLRA